MVFRLIDTMTIRLKEFNEQPIPKYAILSHTWVDEEEISYTDMTSINGTSDHPATRKLGYLKIRGTCNEAQSRGFRYAWVDTCCIDKSSSAELSEAINSMFQWYKMSAVCYVYLTDIFELQNFTDSRWFTRGWTLQELVAPANVTFFNATWQFLGTKMTLTEAISARTGVPLLILQMKEDLSAVSIAQKMSWASQRETTRIEDIAYCLLGVFDIAMPLLYGEGSKAFIRLEEEILRGNSDQSLFSWGIWKSDWSLSWNLVIEELRNRGPTSGIYPAGQTTRVLAQSPKEFTNCSLVQPLTTRDSSSLMTNRGLSLTMPIISGLPLFSHHEGGITHNLHIGLLQCSVEGHTHRCVGVPLIHTGNEVFQRVILDDDLSAIPVPSEVAAKAIKREVWISNSTTAYTRLDSKAREQTEESIVLELPPELGLELSQVSTWLRQKTILNEASRPDSNVIRVVSNMPKQEGRMSDRFTINLYSPSVPLWLTLSILPPRFSHVGHHLNGPAVVLQSSRKGHPTLPPTLSILYSRISYGDAHVVSLDFYKEHYELTASINTAEVVNQRIYLVHLAIQRRKLEKTSKALRKIMAK